MKAIQNEPEHAPGTIKNDLGPSSLNLGFVEELYAAWLRDPGSVPPDWRRYFAELPDGDPFAQHPQRGPSFRAWSLFNPPSPARSAEAAATETLKLASFQDRVNQLIRNYRVRGHIIARIDPLGLPRPQPPELDPDFYGFTEAEMARQISWETIESGRPLPLREVLKRLGNTYCRSIGVNYMHIDDLAVRRWLQERMEGSENRLLLSRQEQLRILTRLTDAVTFEEFIRKKFVGATSFSLEGSESLIPLLDLAIEKAGEQDLGQIVLGMAHRGRLNVLVNIMGKSACQIFREFEDADPRRLMGHGDVKYHLGYERDWITASHRTVHLSLCFNPSHLEFVNPIVLGRTRAQQDRAGEAERAGGLALLIHGDASFAGEGVVQETLNLSQLPGYRVGGALHVLVNNQIGFTTAPAEGRSSTYATDVARMLQVPIFHVNGENPEAVAQVVRLALDFRLKFKRDVFIDMYGYRRLGHNEADEPSFTQPVLYRAIQKRKPVREGYLEHLLKLNELTRAEADAIAAQRRRDLELELSEARREEYQPPANHLNGLWRGYSGGPEPIGTGVETGLPKARLAALLEAQTQLPETFHPHPKLARFLQARQAMATGQQPLDWAAAEGLVFASLACQGIPVRLSGQDSGRGTFSQRHAILYDYEDGHPFIPLQHLAPDQAPVEIWNSPLSELGVLGFEYGYSLDCPQGLILWEAQYGDFVNAAQVIVDQFIASAEDKWRWLSGIVLLLPHGFEGQGPEHSSARPENFLTLSAQDNLQVVYPTTPAQYFHCLRRQVLSRWRKPLVVLTPKGLLRHPQVVSTLDDCARGPFQRIIPDSLDPDQVQRLLLCTGKIYYELVRRREELKRWDIAIARVEQLYPFYRPQLQAVLAPYRDGIPVVWVQEEPENMGAWRHFRLLFGERLLDRFPFAGVSRPASASPATGSASAHRLEQQELLTEAIEGKGLA